MIQKIKAAIVAQYYEVQFLQFPRVLVIVRLRDVILQNPALLQIELTHQTLQCFLIN